MNFACIHDCSVCPFYGLDVASRIYQAIDRNNLPQGLQNPSTTVKEPEEEKETITEEIKQETANLPATQELQYEVSDVKKKSFFNWRKNK